MVTFLAPLSVLCESQNSVNGGFTGIATGARTGQPYRIGVKCNSSDIYGVRLPEIEGPVRENLLGEVEGMTSNVVVSKKIHVDHGDLEIVPSVNRQDSLRLKIHRSRFAVQGAGLTVDQASVTLALADRVLHIVLHIAKSVRERLYLGLFLGGQGWSRFTPALLVLSVDPPQFRLSGRLSYPPTAMPESTARVLRSESVRGGPGSIFDCSSFCRSGFNRSFNLSISSLNLVDPVGQGPDFLLYGRIPAFEAHLEIGRGCGVPVG